MAKAFKVSGQGLETEWMNASELLNLSDNIMCESDPHYEAWNVNQSLEDLTEIGYTIQTRPIKDVEKAINKLRF